MCCKQSYGIYLKAATWRIRNIRSWLHAAGLYYQTLANRKQTSCVLW